jgi:hypothetical protein
MKLITWNNDKVLRLITYVLNNQNLDTKELNKDLSLEFGGTQTAIAIARVSVMRCLQGFESSSEKGDKKGYTFGGTFKEVVNHWYNESYQGGLTRNQLSYKF